MSKITTLEKKKFEIRSFEKRWMLATPNLKVSQFGNTYSIEGASSVLSPDKIRILLNFEGLEHIKELMEQALMIERFLTHEPFTVTVSFHNNQVSVKKNMNTRKENKLHHHEEVFFEMMKKCGVPELEQRATDYTTNFVFETEETQRELEELMQHFNYLTVNWVKEIEKRMEQELAGKIR